MRTIDIVQSKTNPGPAVPAFRPAANPAEELRQHVALCQEILEVVERESQVLRGSDGIELQPLAAQKKSLLARLNKSVERLRQERVRWQQLCPAERAQHPEIGGLLRENQDLIMKIIVLDRENEQALLRRGLVPASQLPPAQRQRPHFVTELYRTQGGRL